MYLSDIHTHSIASGHGTHCTISAMAKAASRKGLRLLGITDHGPATLAAGAPSYFRSLLKENESSLKNIINMVDKYKSDNKQIIIELSQFSLEAIEYFKKNNKQTTNEIINQAIQHYFTSFFNET